MNNNNKLLSDLYFNVDYKSTLDKKTWTGFVNGPRGTQSTTSVLMFSIRTDSENPMSELSAKSANSLMPEKVMSTWPSSMTLIRNHSFFFPFLFLFLSFFPLFFLFFSLCYLFFCILFFSFFFYFLY